MTRNEIIQRYCILINAVFLAENSIAEEWEFRLRAAKHMGKKEREKISQEYITAIAEEIVSKSI